MSNDPREPDETSPPTDDGGGEPANGAAPKPDSPAPQQPVCPSKIGRYRVERLLGKGGFGLVYLAHDDQLQRHVAIKVPHRELTSQPADAEAYLDEARMLARLDHPHIVPVHDVGSTAEFPCFFVSKYIDGTSLDRRMEQSALTYAEAAELTATIAEALHYAHKQGLVHRDIKPGNILLDHNGKPYVVDFGLALKEAELGRGSHYAGTLAYMSPEQARGQGHRVDGRSDIYSLGAVLYQMLTRHRTFTAESSDQLLELIATLEPKPPRQIDDQIPKELERICLKALSQRLSDRYTTAKDMADDLRQFLAISKASGNAASPTKRSIPTSPRVPRETWHLDEIGEVVVVKLGDDFLGPADLVRDYTDGLLNELDAGNWRKVVIDFGDLRYINSSAFIPLLRVLRRLRETGGRVRLCNVSTYVYEVMRAIGIDRVFDIAEDRESALRDW